MNLPMSIAAGAASVFLGFSVSWTGQEIAEDVVTPRSLTLESLAYNGDGTVTQTLSGDVPADWSAQIIRPENGISIVLCSGSGRGPNYDGTPQTFTTSDWTFDDCPELRTGDIGTASWDHRNEDGLYVSVTGRFVVEK